ncbi:MAG: CarD family transcriptional regulator, partial [Anaerolineales bacterium]
MNLSALLAPLREQSTYQQLLELLLEKTSPDQALEIPKAIRPMLVSALCEDLHQPILYIVPQLQRLLTLYEEMPYWTPNVDLHRFPNPNPLFYELSPWSETVRNERIAALAALTQGEGPGNPQEEIPRQSLVLLASSRALMTRSLSKRTFLANSRYVKQGAVFRFDQLISLLVSNGYAQSNLVTERGQFSRRGGILDLWPPAEKFPVRLEFFGDDVESLRCFDPASQRTIKETTWVRITPAREGLPRDFDDGWLKQLPGVGNEDDPFLTDWLELFLPLMNSRPSGVSNFFRKDAVVIFDDKTAFTNAVADIEQQALSMHEEAVEEGRISSDFPLPYLTLSDLEESLENYTTLDLGMNAGIADLHAVPLSNSFTPGPRFGGQLESILKHLSDIRTDHETAVVVSRQAQRLCELWSEYDNAAEVRQKISGELHPGEITFIQGPLSGGWIQELAQGDRIHLLSDAELFGWSRPRPRRRSLARPSAPEASFADLRHGDYVVHIDYGIGRFIGLVDRRLDEIQREFLLIEYADGDQLYIPVHQADRISRYVGANSSSPSLSRLGSSEWARSKGKAREAVEQVARDLLELYAERQTVLGTAFSPDTVWQKELEASFAHQETEDQIRALEAIKGDMERSKPMDRLICGDVGYGKTEVALRAAFKAVMHGKQTAMLVPTTVLAQQHFKTFRRRLAAFPIKVEMLSRFRSRSETAEIIKSLASGEIDMVIGTHRLLQPD